MTAGFALAAVGIWIPQIFVGVVELGPEDRPEIDNQQLLFEDELADEGLVDIPGYAVDWDSELEEDLLGAGASLPRAGSPEDSGGGSSVGNSVASILQRMNLLDSTPSRVKLSELMSALRQDFKAPMGFGGLPTTDASEESIGMGNASAHQAQMRQVLQTYCESQALMAVIYNRNGGVAMLGSRPVRIGDDLELGIRVAGIDKRGVLLALGSLEQRIQLPSFQARRGTTDSPSELNASGSSPLGDSEPSPGDASVDGGAADSGNN